MTTLANHEIAAHFGEMAELLRIRGGDAHRVKAFERSGQVIAALPEPVDRMLRFGSLAKVPGIGDGTVHRIKQLLRTGSCDDLDQLRRDLPAGLRQLLKLKGLGPRTVRRLHRQLGIRTVEQLAWAIERGTLAQTMRLGPERIHALREEIAVFRRQGGKVPLIEAERTIAPIADALRAVSGVEVVSSGGSVRRRHAMIGDLDLLVAATDPAPVVEAFSNLPHARSVLSRRVDGGSIRLESLQQVDLWVFPPECWGAGLHAFTGNKEHLINLRTRAGRMGLHISEHGISDRATHRRVAFVATEDEIYRAVELPFIEIELRQNLGEIEAAEGGRLPTLVTEADLRGDLHMHTTWSDGASTAREMALEARKLGLEYIAITDHSQSLTIARGLDARRLRSQQEELSRLRGEIDRPAVLAGIEVDILEDGSLDLDASVLRSLDWVVASVHSRLDQDGHAMTDRMIRAMETGLVDCIGHPTGRKLGRRDGAALDLDRLFEAARRLGVALEVNGNPYRMDLDDAACRRAREGGVTLVLSTDAHSPAELHRRPYALDMARRGWIEPKHVLNTLPLDELRAFRRDRLRRHGIAVPGRSGQPRKQHPGDDRAPAGSTFLVDALGAPLDGALRARLEAFLASGDDAELETALRTLSENPVQRAFDLLLGSA